MTRILGFVRSTYPCIIAALDLPLDEPQEEYSEQLAG